ncbi:histidine phosphotransferase ChpT [Rhodoligotrophos appendicifer]|uniref:histidine phosphotransferase ChpT n=1 Tax=Rhodoligotrophos appendicifer TaxID=987056 RepID=UPI0011856E2B|nr:histidine phosphotransferase family protein [Rhodoligotrophos appendicifer]
MSRTTLLSDLDLAALLCSRVCHDVISPVGAITNGLEVLDDEDDEAMKEIALDLIRRSARTASAKLQFCRMAFGASGSAGAYLDLTEAEQIARGFIGDEKVKLSWDAPIETRPKAEVKLLLNLLLIAVSTIPRGGQVAVLLKNGEFSVTATGEGAKIPEKTARIIDGELLAEDLDPRHVQTYYTVRIAEDLGYVVKLAMDGNTAVASAMAAPPAAAEDLSESED